MSHKIRIKIGPLELEYEGDGVFLKEELPNLLEEVAEIYKGVGNQGIDTDVRDNNADTQSGEQESVKKGQGSIRGTTKEIAEKLDSKTGSDLIVAAATHLIFVQGRDPFSRRELLKEMQNASPYYRKTYSNNLSSYLETLVKEGKLVEHGTDRYTLSASARRELESRLA